MDSVDEIVAYYETHVSGRVRRWAEHVLESLVNDKFIAEKVAPIAFYRVKSPKSLRKKLGQKSDGERSPITIGNLEEQITDLGGVRVLVHDPRNFLAVTDAIVRCQKAGKWEIRETVDHIWSRDQGSVSVQPVGGKALDAELFPREVNVREDGLYRSRHFSLVERGGKTRVELQLRTVMEEAVFETMHRLVYKGDSGEEMLRLLTRIAELGAVSDKLLSDAYFDGSGALVLPDTAGQPGLRGEDDMESRSSSV